MNIFFHDPEINLTKTWTELIDDINQIKKINSNCNSGNYYDLFRSIVISMLHGIPITLNDLELQEHEESIELTQPLKIGSKLELIEKLTKCQPNWSLALFTSGTTGQPKKVNHNFNSITRFVKKTTNSQSHIWGFAYNPTHMAGIQVFMQSILNGNTIIRLFGIENKKISDAIEKFQITHISATPTFFRLFQSVISFDSTLKITFGGEKFDKALMQKLKSLFPNAKFVNIYASTEGGSIFRANNDIFSIDTYLHSKCKIEENELVLHKSLMGDFESSEDDWYYTGDLVEIINEDPLEFKFVSRKNEMINVGGYKVNPQEVEETMLSIPYVQQVYVYSKSNSITGNILLAEVVLIKETESTSTEKMIKEKLRESLPEYKIPRIIKFVPKLELTRTGKLKREK
jgi:acyl-coenzyme A synthetase/AMP-(fatty) acid ligase